MTADSAAPGSAEAAEAGRASPPIRSAEFTVTPLARLLPHAAHSPGPLTGPKYGPRTSCTERVMAPICRRNRGHAVRGYVPRCASAAEPWRWSDLTRSGFTSAPGSWPPAPRGIGHRPRSAMQGPSGGPGTLAEVNYA